MIFVENKFFESHVTSNYSNSVTRYWRSSFNASRNFFFPPSDTLEFSRKISISNKSMSFVYISHNDASSW